MANYDTLVIGGILVFFFLVVIVIIIRRRGKDKININQIEFGELTHDGMKKKIDINGNTVKKGKLVMGYNTIGNVSKFYEFSGKGAIKQYDVDSDVVLDGEESKDYEFLAFKIKSNSRILSALNIRCKIYLINTIEVKDIRFDPRTKTWHLPRYIDFFRYGKIWIADDISKQYLRKFALGFFDESVQTGLMNQPNRIIALDTDQAKKINYLKTLADAESRKYEKTKQAGETVVT